MMIEGIDLTLGVEEEYQIINPETRDLDSYVRRFLENSLIDFGKKTLVPARELMTGGMEKDLKNAAELDSLQDVLYMQTILENGTSADRQLAAYRQARDEGADGKEALQAVVDHICRETVMGV